MAQSTNNPFNPPVAQEPVLTEIGDKKQNRFSMNWYQWCALTVARALFAPVSSAVPATSSSAGTPGQISYDSNFGYICIASNLWKRFPLSAF